ncbi:hypothetical protein [uncultured Roseibium sp.]|uniref:hypothetical protein n=1 Tax=uncultured Roseibium sp. TaxID=1936171 RepID=UPI00261250B6|nr:hypothetical protein [uncultured Roseibium sp.]
MADKNPNKRPAGNQLYKNEKPHIWQEWKLDMDARKPTKGAPFWGEGWMTGVWLLITFFVLLAFELGLPNNIIALIGRALQ